MHIHEADARRRDGETSWAEYGRDAAAAEGKGLLTRITGRRDGDGRLKELAGMRLGDLRPMLTPRALEELETALWEWRRGSTARDEAEAKMHRVFREGTRPSLLTEAGREWASKPSNSREFQEKFGAGRAFRLSLYAQAGVDPGVSGLPLLEAWLHDLRRGIALRQRGTRPSEREAPLLDEMIEEVSEAGVNWAARRSGVFEELPPGFEP
jgi:hypothetical protein